MHARALSAFGLAFALVACGDNGSNPPDAGPPVDAPPFMLCGNGIPEGTEECDDSNETSDDGCSSTCTIECGDGAVTGTELCDTGIADGDGACPTEETCTDDDPCTTGIVSGGDCDVACDFAITTAPIDGDSCCPKGQDATTDNDCTALCGNGIVEAPEETCDTAIAAGSPGACPTACDDGDFCTTDALTDGGTCVAACAATDITEIGPDDECCPPGANAGNDPNCLTSCGDGAVTDTETCDTAIAPGNPGACPTACNDGNACTTDNLVNAGTCLDACTTTPIGPGPADSCCPAGSDLGDDPDCPPACGDGVITAPETCDDNNSTSGDGCSSICRLEPVGFRFTDLDLKDPHLFAEVFTLCPDVTNSPLGQDGVNPLLQNNIQNDEDSDGLLDLSLLNSFLPLVQTAGSTTTTDLIFPDCTAPMSSTSCQLPAGADHTIATATNMGAGAVCLGTIANTTGGYTPSILTPTASPGTCYVANAGTVTVSLSGIPITLTDAHIAGVWFGSPATEIRDGLIRGFISEAQANATIIPEGTTGIGSIDGEPLSSLLRGGVGNCNSPSPALGDQDNNGTDDGWYFYLNFSAARVPYSEL